MKWEDWRRPVEVAPATLCDQKIRSQQPVEPGEFVRMCARVVFSLEEAEDLLSSVFKGWAWCGCLFVHLRV